MKYPCDFNINLLQNGNYVLNRKELATCQRPDIPW